MKSGKKLRSMYDISGFKRIFITPASLVLTRTERKKLISVTIVQVGLGFLDLIGIALVGILGALAVVGVQSRDPGNRVNYVLTLLNLENSTFQFQAAILGIFAGSVLVLRTFLSVFFTRKILLYLNLRGARISSDLVSKILAQDISGINKRDKQGIVYSVTSGVSAIVIGVIATSITLISDLALLLVIITGLFVIDYQVALIIFSFFASIGFLLYRLMSVRARNLGMENAEISLHSNRKIIEVLESYRESVVRNRRDYYSRVISKSRYDLARIQAETDFMPNVSKYVIEIALVIGALLISAVQFLAQDAEQAVGTLAIFLAAGSRIAPAVLRIQQASIQIGNSVGFAAPTLKLIEELKDSDKISAGQDGLLLAHNEFSSNISISDLTVRYNNKVEPAISNISLEISEFTITAIVGPSGAGKTTLVDAILGVVSPETGKIKISGHNPLESISLWPGAISYVPQDVKIFSGSIAENVALGFPSDLIDVGQVKKALDSAHLLEFALSLPQGLDTQVGDGGSNLSGGQRQRLGIARALYTSPKLLILDEATSALDGETEAEITDAIYSLKGRTTLIVIAHRLSTIMNADHVIYMQDGVIRSQGKFEEVRASTPDFDRQAQLMGIN
jgi:ABC-type multidrug transport system fused ATPase/permease subunit